MSPVTLRYVILAGTCPAAGAEEDGGLALPREVVPTGEREER